MIQLEGAREVSDDRGSRDNESTGWRSSSELRPVTSDRQRDEDGESSDATRGFSMRSRFEARPLAEHVKERFRCALGRPNLARLFAGKPLRSSAAFGIFFIAIALTSTIGIFNAYFVARQQQSANLHHWQQHFATVVVVVQEAIDRVDVSALDRIVNQYSDIPQVVSAGVHAFNSDFLYQDITSIQEANDIHCFEQNLADTVESKDRRFYACVVEDDTIFSAKLLPMNIGSLIFLSISLSYATFLFIRMLTEPASRLMDAVAQYDLGEWTRPEIVGAHEFDRLGRTLDGMVQRIECQATIDPVAGIHNRRQIEQLLKQSLEKYVPLGRNVALLFIDLDHFKNINDGLGHIVGDKLLAIVARRLEALVGDQGLVGRFGGDEFLLCYFGIGDIGSFAEHIAETISGTIEIGGHSLNVRASIGCASAPRDGQHVQELIKRADIALYEAKGRGRACFVEFSSELLQERQQLMRAEHWARDAFVQDQVDFHLQPIVHSCNGRVWGWESLLRPQAPEDIPMPPPRFVALVSELGLAETLTLTTLESLHRNLDFLDLNGHRSERITINLSPHQLRVEDVERSIHDFLVEQGISLDRMVIEVTEESYHSETAIINRLRWLSERGISLALDDFGAGFASIACIRDVPFSIIKLDKSLTRAVPGDIEAAKLLEGTQDLVSRMGLASVAEGVETEQQHHFLRDIGCTYCQGYYFGKPGPIPLERSAEMAISTS